MKSFYSGEWRESSESLEDVNPYTGEPFADLSLFDLKDLDQAVASAGNGVKALSALPKDELHKVFERFNQLLLEKQEEFSRLISEEQGKPISEARVEVESTINSISLLAENPFLVGPKILPLAVEASVEARLGYTLRHPHGVVAIITPNPQPFVLPVVQTVYALAAGNSVILKPSIHTPVVVLRMVKLLLEAGLPPQSISCIIGSGNTVGQALMAHRGIDHIIAAGAFKTVRKIRSKMGMLTSQLQWGCVATCVVGKSASVKKVSEEILKVAMECSGQAAFTPTWIACFEEKHDELREVLREGMEKLILGDPLRDPTQIGPLAEKKKVVRLESRIADELAMGAEIVTGGRVAEQLYQPMLLDSCDLQTTMFSSREIAAPIIGMSRIRKAREATSLLADQRHHVLTLFSNDRDWASRQAVKMPFNNVHINGLPSWRDGLICLPGHPTRTGRRTSEDRVSDMSHVRDIIFH